MGFFKKWLKEELLLFLWGWGIILLIIIFAMFAVAFFPDIAINLTGVLVLFITMVHVFLWFKNK
ncbi:hypothetical protein [Atlantibacter sp.]|uniref:hypothetical protein n=1 Tax=Atlantibacter sp. TaxID=1903473 RepID=UPI0028A9C61D|nr:hypothetical protein [Atlantibacter sp.]